MTNLTNRKKMFLVRSYENWADPYFLKKIKNIHSEHRLDAVFSESFEKFPSLEKYCLNKNIETIKVEHSSLEDYFFFIIRYTTDDKNNNKKNLANLIYNKKMEKLDYLFNWDMDFITYFEKED